MQQQAEIIPTKRDRPNGRTSPRGRKSKEGQEEVIKLAAIRESIGELLDLYTKKTEAAEALSSAVKAAAEKSGLLAAVVQKFVKARAGDKFEEAKRNAEQLSMVFEEIGEE